MLVGDIGLHLAADGRTAEAGFTLRPDSQGQGIATVAAHEGLRLLFDGAAARRNLGITDSWNPASVRLLERVGFRYDLHREVVFRGEPCVELVSFIALVWAGGPFGRIFGIRPPGTDRSPGG